jgi:hypothetical protein
LLSRVKCDAGSKAPTLVTRARPLPHLPLQEAASSLPQPSCLGPEPSLHHRPQGVANCHYAHSIIHKPSPRQSPHPSPSIIAAQLSSLTSSPWARPLVHLRVTRMMAPPVGSAAGLPPRRGWIIIPVASAWCRWALRPSRLCRTGLCQLSTVGED